MDERDVGRIIVPGQDMTLDIARYRGPTLEDDLRGRDFTINAMALPINGSTADRGCYRSTQWAVDLAEKQIRIIHPQSIMDDPVRALRAVRFATQFGFALTSETAEAAIRRPGRCSARRRRPNVCATSCRGYWQPDSPQQRHCNAP
jgi:hypothetical protein